MEADDLVRENIALIEKTVWSVGHRFPAHVDRDEMRGVAAEALVRASRAYRPDRGASFPTFAWRRLTGALLDYLRVLDPYSRVARQAINRGETPRGPGGREATPVRMVELREDLYGDGDIGEDVAARIDAVRALRRLSGREGAVLLRRTAGWTQAELAAELDVTDSRVCQIEVRARRRVAGLIAA